MKYLIVESPAKARKFSGYLPTDEYKVISSYGHFRDLDPKTLSIEVEDNYKPNYIVSGDKKKIGKLLKDAVKEVGKDNIILGPDDDREGEAIGFHIAEHLKIPLNQTKRIKFNEISKKAILKALETQIPLDKKWIDAQQARRIIDRLVGYKLTPLLWKEFPEKGLSAGRVQTASLRIISELEKKIKAYSPEYTYEITGTFDELKGVYNYHDKDDDLDEKDILKMSMENLEYHIKNSSSKKEIQNPPPPFTTSTLQQEAGMPITRTMMIAQKLYEAGLITYMRTDSVNLAPDYLAAAKEKINEDYGEKYQETRAYKTKTKGAQEAHEAIRPTDIDKSSLPDKWDSYHKKVYSLIYKRTLASQMSAAKYNIYTLKISNDKINGTFTITDKIMKFDGWKKLYSKEESRKKSPVKDLIKNNKSLTISEATSTEVPDNPVARFTEASLVKKLESSGIGRPSTFASTIKTLYDRKYIISATTELVNLPRMTITIDDKGVINEKNNPLKRGGQKGRIFITELGERILGYLLTHFDNLFQINFTSDIEEEMDKIASGDLKMDRVIDKVYKSFQKEMENEMKKKNMKQTFPSLGNHPKSKKPIYKLMGKFGPCIRIGDKGPKFYGLSGWMVIHDKSFEDISLEDAVEISSFPKKLGEKEGVKYKLFNGSNGFYIQADKNGYTRNYSLKGVRNLPKDVENIEDYI